ncbi:MAG: hypothetical protein ACPLRR_03620 [Candidatus Saccharicenans sp.]
MRFRLWLGLGRQKELTRTEFLSWATAWGDAYTTDFPESQTAAGFIIMAGLTRPMEDTILEQTRYLLALQGPATEETKKKL